MKRAVCGTLLCLVLGCHAASPTAPALGPASATVSVFAAASAGDVLEEIGRDFQAETGIQVLVNPGASSALAVQIEGGSGADVFLSADETWANWLQEQTLCVERRDLLGNRLVVVVPADNQVTLKGLNDLKAKSYRRVALAGEGVPAGEYAREALEKAGVWNALLGRAIFGGDVRATLTYVARGEADAGFVYATDAAASRPKVRVAYAVPENLHKPIRYPLLLIRRDQPNPAARRFYDYLGGDKAAAVFGRAGFKTLPQKP